MTRRVPTSGPAIPAAPVPARGRLLVLAAAGTILAIALVACGPVGASPSATSDGASPSAGAASASLAGDARAVGLVTDIVTSGPVEVASFTVRTDDGQTIDFTVGTLDVTGGGFPAEHLSEHRLASEPVLVLYRDDGGKHVAYRLLDAVEATPS